MIKPLQTFFYVFRNSLLNLDYYRDLISVKFSFSLKYFLGLLYLANLVLIVSVLIGLLTLIPQLPQWAFQTKRSLIDAFPQSLVIKIQKGELSINQPQPYFYNAPSAINNGKHLFVVDTTANPQDYPRFNSFFFVTKNLLVMPNSDSGNQDTQTVSLSGFQDSVLDYPTYVQAVKGWLPLFDYIVPVFWAFFLAFLLFGPLIGTAIVLPFKLLHLLIIAALLLLLTRLFRFSFKLSQLYRLAMHASTLPIVFFTFLALFSLSPTIPFGYSLLLGVFLAAILYNLHRHHGQISFTR